MANEALFQVLEMVAQGRLTVEEAEEVLRALQAPAATPAPPSEPVPDMAQFRRYWEIPFVAGLILLGLTAICISSARSPWLIVCGWAVLVVAVVLVAVGWLSQWSPWLHVRVVPRQGPKFALSLPLPLQFAMWGLALARPLVIRLAGHEAARYLALTTLLLEALHDTPSTEPITLDIDDEDGDAVHIYLG